MSFRTIDGRFTEIIDVNSYLFILNHTIAENLLEVCCSFASWRMELVTVCLIPHKKLIVAKDGQNVGFYLKRKQDFSLSPYLFSEKVSL